MLMDRGAKGCGGAGAEDACSPLPKPSIPSTGGPGSDMQRCLLMAKLAAADDRGIMSSCSNIAAHAINIQIRMHHEAGKLSSTRPTMLTVLGHRFAVIAMLGRP